MKTMLFLVLTMFSVSTIAAPGATSAKGSQPSAPGRKTAAPTAETETKSEAETGSKTEAESKTETIAESVKEAGQVAGDRIDQAVVDAEQKMSQARGVRAQAGWFGAIEYSYLDILLPSKYGIIFGLNRNQNESWEIEYLRGSLRPPGLLDRFGGLDEQRLSLLWRNYLGTNSFNIFAGAHYGQFTIHLGDAMISRVTGVDTVEAMRLEALGGTVGIGNRWSLKNGFTFGVDWISWSQPLVVLSRKAAFINETPNADDRSVSENAMTLVSYFPRFSALKVHLGYSF